MKKKRLVAIVAVAFMAVAFLGFTFSILGSERQADATFYMVAEKAIRDKNDALNFAVTVKSRGGAGYLYLKNDRFYVVLSCYEKLDDAKKVAKKLQGVDVVELKIAVSKNPAKAAAQRVGIEISNELYDLSIAFDGGKMDVKTLNKRLQTLKGTLNEKLTKTTNSSIDVSAVASFMSAIDNLLTSNEKYLGWNLKYQRIRLLNICKDI